MRYKILFVIIIKIFLFNCNKPATKNDSAFLSLLIVQNSGNCAVIEKTNLDDKVIYRASGKTVRSGGCRESTFLSITSDSVQAKNFSDTYLNNLSLTFDKFNQCSELIKSSIIERERSTEELLISSAIASPDGCLKFGYRYVYCKDNPSRIAYSNKFRYLTITNSRSEMRENYDSQIRINSSLNKVSEFQYSDGAILNLRVENSTEFSLFSGADNMALLSAYPLNAECFNKVVLSNTNLKTAYSKIPPLQSFFKEEITNSERKALSETITPELNCIYGNGVEPIAESGGKPAVGICPASYLQY